MRNLAFTLISQKHEKQVKNRHGSVYEQTFDALKLVLKYYIVELVHILDKLILIEASHLLLYVLFKKIIAESFTLETSLAPKLKPRKIIIFGQTKNTSSFVSSFYYIHRNNCRKCSIEKAFHKSFTIFTEKKLCWTSFFLKFQDNH